MISEQAQSSFNHIFKSAVMSNFSDSYNNSCEIEPISDHKEITEAEFSVLTITSSSFRFLTLLHFDNNESTIKYFTNHSIEEDGSDENHANNDFIDGLLEFCNLTCGAMNRNLHAHFSHSGMSTPYVLTRPCLDFVYDLDPGYIKHFRITINLSLVLHATLYICNYDVVDFAVDTSKADESTGNLELFQL
jgi:hypothetical protein